MEKEQSKLSRAVGCIIEEYDFLPNLEKFYDKVDYYCKTLNELKCVLKGNDVDFDMRWHYFFEKNYAFLDESKVYLNLLSSFLSVITMKEENMADLEKYDDIFQKLKNIQTIIFKEYEGIKDINETRLTLAGKSFSYLEADLDAIKFREKLEKTNFLNKDSVMKEFFEKNEFLKKRYHTIQYDSELSLIVSSVNNRIIELEVILDVCMKIYIIWNKLKNPDMSNSMVNMY